MQLRPRVVTVGLVVMDVVFTKQQGPHLNEFKLVPWSPSSDPVANRLREDIFHLGLLTGSERTEVILCPAK